MHYLLENLETGSFLNITDVFDITFFDKFMHCIGLSIPFRGEFRISSRKPSMSYQA
jgi:hypothetical protein